VWQGRVCVIFEVVRIEFAGDPIIRCLAWKIKRGIFIWGIDLHSHAGTGKEWF
jgi:hypothetical protein